ncbi:hypothetical protein D3C78_1041960 [compost metagenome]
MNHLTYMMNASAEPAVKAVTHSNNRGTIEAGLWADYEIAGDTLVIKKVNSGFLPSLPINYFSSFTHLSMGDQGVIAVVAKSLNMKKIKVGQDYVYLVDSMAESEKILNKAKLNSAVKTLGVLAGVAAVVGVASWLSNR